MKTVIDFVNNSKNGINLHVIAKADVCTYADYLD